MQAVTIDGVSVSPGDKVYFWQKNPTLNQVDWVTQGEVRAPDFVYWTGSIERRVSESYSTESAAMAAGSPFGIKHRKGSDADPQHRR